MARLRDTIDRNMFYGATPIIFERAREMRLNPTEAEIKLWDVLKNKQMLGLRFKFQHPINQFIADFYCHKLKLVIEIDGKIHDVVIQKERDEGRTYELEKLGVMVIRFKNEEVMKSIEMVKVEIERVCSKLLQNVNE
jgi:very-short-patch-repair endonuclease